MRAKALWLTAALVLAAPLAALAIPQKPEKKKSTPSKSSPSISLPPVPAHDRPSSRELSSLRPSVRSKVQAMLDKAAKAGINLVVTEAHRSCKRQNDLYEQGRTKPGKIVTNAKCGESDHNVDVAVDVVEVKNGEALWDNPNWEKIGQIGESVGLKWGGRWTGLKDLPHFYDRSGKTTAQLWRESQGLSV